MRIKEMKISEKGINLIKKYEGLQLVAYKCPAGILTIGWGHTKGVSKGDKVTVSQADKLLLEDVKGAEDTVNSLVVVTINQNQFDALVSFTFNVGSGNFANSTLLKILNKSDASLFDNVDNGIIDKRTLKLAVADEFLRWNKSGTRVLYGLNKRRREERDLFLSLHDM